MPPLSDSPLFQPPWFQISSKTKNIHWLIFSNFPCCKVRRGSLPPGNSMTGPRSVIKFPGGSEPLCTLQHVTETIFGFIKFKNTTHSEMFHTFKATHE